MGTLCLFIYSFFSGYKMWRNTRLGFELHNLSFYYLFFKKCMPPMSASPTRRWVQIRRGKPQDLVIKICGCDWTAGAEDGYVSAPPPSVLLRSQPAKLYGGPTCRRTRACSPGSEVDPSWVSNDTSHKLQLYIFSLLNHDA